MLHSTRYQQVTYFRFLFFSLRGFFSVGAIFCPFRRRCLIQHLHACMRLDTENECVKKFTRSLFEATSGMKKEENQEEKHWFSHKVYVLKSAIIISHTSDINTRK